MRIRHALITAAVLLLGAVAHAQPTAGWRAELSQDFHDVSGTVVVVDQDTIQVNDFTYDGGGISVYFYLGAEDARAAFSDGLAIGPQLLGTVFDGTQEPLTIDLPAGETIDGWNAVSVWCVDVSASFGSGTFQPKLSPLPGDFNNDGLVDAADYTVWRDNDSGEYAPDDYQTWRDNYGATGQSEAPALGSSPAPEPTAVCLALTRLVWTRRRSR